MTTTLTNRYRVVGTWGVVPEQIQSIVGKDDAFLLYPEYRGQDSDQAFTDHGEAVGGWSMQYAGKRAS